jgi:hypothetical protein
MYMAEKTAAETVLEAIRRTFGAGIAGPEGGRPPGEGIGVGGGRTNPELQYNILSHTTPAAETVARGITDTGILDRGKRQRMITGALDAITPGESPMPTPKTEPTLDIGKDMPEKVRAGKGGGTASATPAPGEAADTRHPMEKKYNGDIYAALQAMPDEKFKRFVDKHKDAIPGIGYFQDTGPDGKTGTGAVTRIIENPAVAAAQERAKPYEEMTLAEKKLQNEAVHAQGVVENAKATRAYHEGVGRQNDEFKRDRLKFDQEKDWENRFTVKDPETGGNVFNPQAAVIKSMLQGLSIPDRYKGVRQQIELDAKPLEDKYDKDPAVQAAWAKLGISASDPRYIEDRRKKVLKAILEPPKAK